MTYVFEDRHFHISLEFQHLGLYCESEWGTITSVVLKFVLEVIETFSKDISSLPAPVPQAQVSGGALFPCTKRKDGVHRS